MTFTYKQKDSDHFFKQYNSGKALHVHINEHNACINELLSLDGFDLIQCSEETFDEKLTKAIVRLGLDEFILLNK